MNKIQLLHNLKQRRLNRILIMEKWQGDGN